MNNRELRHLRDLAQAATPGPWFNCLNDLIGGRMISTVDQPASQLSTRRDGGAVVVADFLLDKDAVYISACSPDVILRLLDREQNGPGAESNPEEWCIDCGHHASVHKNEKNRACNYWTGSCKCQGFVSRSTALEAVRRKEV